MIDWNRIKYIRLILENNYRLAANTSRKAGHIIFAFTLKIGS